MDFSLRPTPPTEMPSESILSRRSADFPDQNAVSSSLEGVDALVQNFILGASDWKNLASLVAGGLAYRCGKMTLLGPLHSLLDRGRLVSTLLRGSSIGFGLSSEIFAFEFTHPSGDSTFVQGAYTFLTGRESRMRWAWAQPVPATCPASRRTDVPPGTKI